MVSKAQYRYRLPLHNASILHHQRSETIAILSFYMQGNNHSLAIRLKLFFGTKLLL